MSEKVVRRLVALALAIVATAIVVQAQRGQGIARDEVVYMRAGSSYADWWLGVLSFEDGRASEKSITAHFGGPRATDNNREHPPLMKTLFGLSERLFHDRLGWTSELVGYRLPSALCAGVLVALVFLFTAKLWGARAGLFAAALAFLLPRSFFHFQLAAFDGPMVTLWFASLCAYDKALRTRWGFVLLGAVFGLALATKHNALFLPVIFGLHWSWFVWRTEIEVGGSPARRLLRKVRGARPQIWIGVAVIAPLVLIALWPWLWFDTAAHISGWLRFHLQHVHYNFEYLGENWNAPPFPWHVPIVTTFFTVPTVTLAAATMGCTWLVEMWRRGRSIDPRRAPALLLAIAAAVAIAPFLLRTTPIFGAEKHWSTAFPSLCVFAGIGIAAVSRAAARGAEQVWGWARHRLAPAAITAVIGGLAVAAAAAETVDAHPYALSHYTALAGGAPGGADLGMNRQFWGYAARGVLPVIDDYAPAPGQRPVPVYTHDASPAWPLYRRYDLVRPGLPDSGHELGGIRRSQLALVVHELHFRRHDYMIWGEYGTTQPVYVLTTDGVPIVSVYARPGLEPSPQPKSE